MEPTASREAGSAACAAGDLSTTANLQLRVEIVPIMGVWVETYRPRDNVQDDLMSLDITGRNGRQADGIQKVHSLLLGARAAYAVTVLPTADSAHSTRRSPVGMGCGVSLLCVASH